MDIKEYNFDCTAVNCYKLNENKVILNEQKLYAELDALETSSDAFYSVYQNGPDGSMYRIFLYRLARYTDFLLPSALESRGTTFRFTGTDTEQADHWTLVCLPPEKFFNMGENPLTIGLDYNKVEYSMVKEDGSLISTYLNWYGDLALKTKGSLNSDQAVAAMTWLDRPENHVFKQALLEATQRGVTVNMEWTSPLNRIVVPYTEDRLIVLNARRNADGKYVERTDLLSFFGETAVVELLDVPVHEVAALEKGEGIVVFFGNSATPRFVKVKADAYLTLHRLKDGVHHPRPLFDAVMQETADDLKAAFATDPITQTMIKLMEDLVIPAFQEFQSTVDSFYNENKHLSKKDYAIKLNAAKPGWRFGGGIFAVAMNRYIQRSDEMVDIFCTSAKDAIVELYRAQITEVLGDVYLAAD